MKPPAHSDEKRKGAAPDSAPSYPAGAALPTGGPTLEECRRKFATWSPGGAPLPSANPFL